MANPAPAKREKRQDWVEAALYEARRRAPEALRLMAPASPALALGQLLVEREAARRVTPAPRTKRAEARPARPQTVASPATRTSPEPTFWERLESSPVTKAQVGKISRDLAMLPGAARGLWHDAEALGEGTLFAARLFNPIDPFLYPEGEAAWDKVFETGGAAADYIGQRVDRPQLLEDDLVSGLTWARNKLDPRAAPQADTLAGEWKRNWDIGMNRGEALYTIGSMAYGGAELKGLRGFSEAAKLSQAARIEAGLAEGLSFADAVKLAKDYDGIGHHFIPKRFKKYLGDGAFAELIIEHPLNRLKPEGVSKLDFYKTHHGVDPKYYGGPLEGGGGWSGKRLGWEKYDRFGRLWHGRPIPVRKAGLSVPAGAALDEVIDFTDLLNEAEEASWGE